METHNCPVGYRSYIWGNTDTLASVAQEMGVTEQQIADANPDIDFDAIEMGALLCIPMPASGTPSGDVMIVPDEQIPSRGGAPVSNCPAGSTTYAWSQGDTLMGVALRYGVTMQQIRDANPAINFNNIGTGAIVCIPQRRPQCTDGVLHQVRRGETISSIARAYGVTAGQIMDRNPYVDPSELQVGMLLCVPLAAPMPTPTPAPAPTPAPGFTCPTGYTPGTVRYGETYGDILVRYNVSYQAFRLSNPNLNLDRLMPGQRYCVPPMGSRGLCAPGANSHVIAQGENLLGIASRFGTTPGALLRLNANLAPGDFVPGRVICV